MPRAPRSDGQSKPARPAKKRARKAAKPKRPRGRPTRFTPSLARKILGQLSAGVPLTIICSEPGMPCDDTVRNWAAADTVFSRDIARAREAGFDRIALDALAIADAGENDTIAFEKNGHEIEIPDKEWILRSKLRVETRLRLLAKWDPKRYGEKITQEISGPDGGPVKTEGDFRPTADDELVIRRIAETRAKLQAGQNPAT
jgi:hypothetical protein